MEHAVLEVEDTLAVAEMDIQVLIIKMKMEIKIIRLQVVKMEMLQIEEKIHGL